MSVILTDELAEAALRAASKAGYTDLVEGLLSSGVKASALNKAALTIADFYGHSEVVEILRKAIESEEGGSNSPNKRSSRSKKQRALRKISCD
jgi:hypothetical protein